jgi:CheY-like chemotaxis protein
MILIVEDEAVAALVLRRSLEHLGVPSLVVRSNAEALAALSVQHFFGAFLDLNVEDGETFIVADALDALDVPYIFYSATCDRQQIAKAVSMSVLLHKGIGETRPKWVKGVIELFQQWWGDLHGAT